MALPKRQAPMSQQLAWVYSVGIIAATILVIYFNSYYGGRH
jgi:hypothetical protein